MPVSYTHLEDGSPIESGLFRQKYEGAGKHWDIYAADFLQIDSGTIELILKNCAIDVYKRQVKNPV